MLIATQFILQFLGLSLKYQNYPLLNKAPTMVNPAQLIQLSLLINI